MGYYVPNKMPEDCRECSFNSWSPFGGNTICNAGEFVLQTDFRALPFEGRHPNCPLIEVPDGHGRLVDKDELCKRLLAAWDTADKEKKVLISAVMADIVTPIVLGTPTIIPTDREET